MNEEGWHELEKIRFGVDSLNGSNSTPLNGCFFPKDRTIKERLKEILTLFPKEDIIKELTHYKITVNWKIIDEILR